MELNHFQIESLKKAIYPERETGNKLAICYTSLGLAEEAGEVAGKVKRILRGDYKDQPYEDISKMIAGELGDVLWYVSATAREFGYTLEEIAQMNLDKIKKRVEKGTQRGSGDDR